MGLIEWLMKTRMEPNHFQTGIFQSHQFMNISNKYPPLNSERREDSVFKDLLKMCLGLKDRLLASSPEEIELIADLVTTYILQPFFLLMLLHPRFRKVLINPTLTTQKEWSVPLLNGLCQKVKSSSLPSIKRLSMTVDSTMNGPALSCAQPALTGLFLSKWSLHILSLLTV